MLLYVCAPRTGVLNMVYNYYSEQPGQFLEQLLIVSDLRIRIHNCTYKLPLRRGVLLVTKT